MEKIAYGKKPSYEEKHSHESVEIESAIKLYEVFILVYVISIVVLFIEKCYFQITTTEKLFQSTVYYKKR